MARGEVAKDCKVGEGSTSSGRNSGSSAKRSSKSTSDRTLLSTESKVFFRGGGRTFTFLPAPAASLRSGASPAALPLLPSLLPLLLPGAGAGARAGLGGVGGSPRLSKPSPGTRQSEDELGNLVAMVSGPLVLACSSAGGGSGGLLRAVGVQVSWGSGGAGVAGRPSSSDSDAGGSRAGPGSKGCRGAGPGRPGAPASKEPTGMLAMAAFTFWGALGVGRWALGATKL